MLHKTINRLILNDIYVHCTYEHLQFLIGGYFAYNIFKVYIICLQFCLEKEKKRSVDQKS